jgi:gamma-glutamylcysteine synthetase
MSSSTAPGSIDSLVQEYSDSLLRIVAENRNTLPRTYGFEYEFLPKRILDRDDIQRLYGFLDSLGYSFENGAYCKGERKITFEPGGQIEYISSPLKSDDGQKLSTTIDWIRDTNEMIESELGILYVGTDFIPGRYSAPLLLTSERYSGMHDRFLRVDSRGADMMKGTAAIHLHAAITSVCDIELLYPLFCRMAGSDKFGMSENRREIWDRTDRCRCGLPDINPDSDAKSIIEGIVRSTLEATEIRSGKPYYDVENRDFRDFLDHMTTMFTDVRLNVKGVTLELRTPDSRPLDQYSDVWMSFIGECEAI